LAVDGSQKVGGRGTARKQLTRCRAVPNGDGCEQVSARVEDVGLGACRRGTSLELLRLIKKVTFKKRPNDARTAVGKGLWSEVRLRSTVAPFQSSRWARGIAGCPNEVLKGSIFL